MLHKIFFTALLILCLVAALGCVVTIFLQPASFLFVAVPAMMFLALADTCKDELDDQQFDL